VNSDERAAALRANIGTYSDFDEHAYVNGAPHLKHASIGTVYRDLVKEAIKLIGRDPAEISVLDLGAGNGLASVPWLEQRARLTAVDSSDTMLRGFKQRAASFGVESRIIVAEVLDYLASTDETFDVVTHVSMLHHIPDYLELLRLSSSHVARDGCLLTFQDPLRYDRLPLQDRVFDRGSYFAWRLAQGNYRRGLRTRWRRFRHVYSPNEQVDFDEYHVVRNGVDSAAIMAQLQQSFEHVRLVSYWSTYSAPFQWLGERLHLRSYFGILASARRAA
jgi:SAM-dependent methyltransferase